MSPNAPVLIVVVEDNFPDVMLVGESLNSQSIEHEIVHYSDGAEAINELCGPNPKSSYPDVIVLDLNMPKVSGLEVLASIKRCRDLSNVPVAILTSSLSPEERAAADLLGADCFLKKPVDLYDYLQQVGTMLRDLISRGNTRKEALSR